LQREEVKIMYFMILKEDVINSDKEFYFDKYQDLIKNVRCRLKLFYIHRVSEVLWASFLLQLIGKEEE
jgi:hypothetical protein